MTFASSIDVKRRLARLSAAAVLCSLLAACGGSAPPGAPPPPAVTVAEPTKRKIIDYDEYAGRFVAIDSVEVRARVSGYLEKVFFTDGQLVKQGDLLFSIDKRPFQNTLDQARANLATARSNLAYTEADYQRGQALVRDKTITDQTFEQRAQAARNAQASVASGEAAVRQAELDLEFTELRAPVAGRIGDRRVSPGNLVTGGTSGGTTLLAMIVSNDPIRFEFTFDEASLLRYKRAYAGTEALATRGVGTPVDIKLIDEPDFSHQGKIDFLDNAIDRSTGTIRGRGIFDNKDGAFTPGMFGRIRIPASPPADALLVPDTAIGSEQTRKYVLVVGPDNTVAQKYVTLGQVTPDKLRAIKEGIAPDDKIIVNGLMRARPGQKVTPQQQGAAPPQGAPGQAPAAAEKK